MTNEQYLSILESSAQYTKHNLSDMEDDDAVASALVDFQEGAFEVVDNPEKYGLMVVPTIQEVEAWFTCGAKTDEKYWQDAPFTTIGDVFATVLNAFEHFKNTAIEKAQDNNSGE